MSKPLFVGSYLQVTRWALGRKTNNNFHQMITYFFFLFRGRAIKDLLKTLIIHPLTTVTPTGMPSISPAAQLLLSGADRNMFTVGEGDDEVLRTCSF